MVLFYLTINLETKRVINIPKGGLNFIISHLDKKNHNMNMIDNMMLRFMGSAQSGWIDLKYTKMTKYDYLYALTTSKAAMKKITLVPGETYYFFLQDLATTLQISMKRLFEAYASSVYKKDGNILADTYYLPIGMDEVQLIDHLLKQTNRRYKNLSDKIFGIYNKKNWYRYITIASIIQKESASKEEMGAVSSVIYNRLKKGMPLQMDGTLNYAKYSHTKVTPDMIKNDTSSYNTYKNKGLPDDPICAVEIEAIKAAIFPSISEYLYFVKNIDGSGHIFTTNYKDHRKNIKALIKAKKINNKKKKLITEKKQIKIKKETVKKSNIKKDLKKIEKAKESRRDLKKLWD